MSQASDSDKIRAAIDEVEELARCAIDGPFEGMRAGAFTDHHEAMPNPTRVVKVSILPMSWSEGPSAPIYVAFDPEVVLRRCAADRRLLDAYEEADRRAGNLISDEGAYANGLEAAVRLLAEGYGLEL